MNDQSDDAIPDAVWDELVENYDEQQRATLILWMATSDLFYTINKNPASTAWN